MSELIKEIEAVREAFNSLLAEKDKALREKETMITTLKNYIDSGKELINRLKQKQASADRQLVEMGFKLDLIREKYPEIDVFLEKQWVNDEVYNDTK